MLDTDEIGLFGHSLGGAAAAELGRERSDIASIICIDGSMLGEAVPLLNIYAQSHYEEAQELKDFYYNYHVSCQAIESYDILFKSAGHLNFTGLPIISSMHLCWAPARWIPGIALSQ